ncbi:MAG TPA: LppX_LprAFG lipoprotein [Aggregatilineaceae bacterium]|nr:LppX_LprAFG lipoprotein [Aggregatilineaceae bacterium]
MTVITGLSLLAVAGFLLAGVVALASGGSAQIDPTAQQQTVDAAISGLFTQTAVIAQTLGASQTVEAGFQNAMTATAAFEVTVNAGFAQAQTSTAQAGELQPLIAEAIGKVQTARSFALDVSVSGVPVEISAAGLNLPPHTPLLFQHAKGDFVAPDSLRVDLDLGQGDQKLTAQLVAVNGEQFVRGDVLTSGQWVQQPLLVGFTLDTLTSGDTALSSALATLTDLRLVGQEKLNKENVDHFQGQVQASSIYALTLGLIGSGDQLFPIDLYIVPKGQVIRRIVVQIPTPEGAASTEPTTWTITLQDYNKEVTIEVPTPEPTSTPVPPTATPLPPLFPTPVSAQLDVAEEVFQHGRMFWIRENRQIWVMVNVPPENEAGGDWYCYNDTFVEGELETDPNLVPPEGLYQPRRGFGKLWRDHSDLKDGLGWGTTPEFELTSDYTYLAGGYVQDGQYFPGPGEHRFTTLYHQTISFFESQIRGDCMGGTWRLSQ